MNRIKYDKIIIGAGIYGLYSAIRCGERGESILVLEYDESAFARATYINQARVHMGYHYPRSLSTAIKSANYYRRFHEDFEFAIHQNFRQIYSTSAAFSWTNAAAFKKFCESAGIKCSEISTSEYFKDSMCDGAFLTEEDTYDAHIIRDYYLDKINKLKNVDIKFGVRISKIVRTSSDVVVLYDCENRKCEAESRFLLNATYASTNQILDMIENEEGNSNVELDLFKIKYEQCEIILCDVDDKLKQVGLTVMDGPFFSIMPFGKTGYHSLTSVTFTPHITSYNDLPIFACQEGTECSPRQLCNCNECKHKPNTAWDQMNHLARKYINDDLKFEYKQSLFSMKPILKSSEIDDSRPTAIVINSDSPQIISVLSGKINTVYDLDEYIGE